MVIAPQAWCRGVVSRQPELFLRETGVLLALPRPVAGFFLPFSRARCSSPFRSLSRYRCAIRVQLAVFWYQGVASQVVMLFK